MPAGNVIVTVVSSAISGQLFVTVKVTTAFSQLLTALAPDVAMLRLLLPTTLKSQQMTAVPAQPDMVQLWIAYCSDDVCNR